MISCGTTLSEETTSFIIGNLLDAVSLMHKHKILHRDIKPENIVLVHVLLLLFRAISSYVISDGLSIKNRNSGAPSAGHLSTCRPSSSRGRGMTRRWTSGQWGFLLLRCIMGVLLLTFRSTKTYLK